MNIIGANVPIIMSLIVVYDNVVVKLSLFKLLLFFVVLIVF